MKMIVNTNIDQLERDTALMIFDAIKMKSLVSKRINLGLVGGTSVAGTYQNLSKIEDEAWKHVNFWLIDERNVPLNDENSNYKLVKDLLLNNLLEKNLITEEQIFPMDTSIGNVAEDYYSKLQKHGGKIDIAILSSGDDNHVGAIFPNLEYPDEKSYVLIYNSPKPPAERITISPALLSKTDTAFLYFLGTSKKNALTKFKNKDKLLPIESLYKIRNLNVISDQK